MRIPIRSTVDLGLALRAVRRHSGVRIDDLAATARVSKQFTQDVEHGKPTVQFGRVLKLLAELGIPLELNIPDDAALTLAALRAGEGARDINQLRKASTDTMVPPASKRRV
jgi:transcriptional regulator with XRE-family HTH domain